MGQQGGRYGTAHSCRLVLGLRAAGVLLRCGTNAQMLMAANATHSTAVPKCDVLNLMF
jgi:hypothetical protein